MRFGTWNVRSLCTSGSSKTLARELNSMLHLVEIQFRWDNSDTQTEEIILYFLYMNGNDNHKLGTGYFAHKRCIPAVMRAIC
jgi:hypothetical protein